MISNQIPHKSLTNPEICVIAYALQAYNITSNHKYQQNIHNILSVMDTSLGDGEMAKLNIQDFKLAIRAINEEHDTLLIYFSKTKMKNSVKQNIKSAISKLNYCVQISITPSQLHRALLNNAKIAKNKSVRTAVDNLYNYPKSNNIHDKALGLVLKLLISKVTKSPFASDKKHVKKFGLISQNFKQSRKSPHCTDEIQQLLLLKAKGCKYVTCTYSLTHYQKTFTPISLIDLLNLQIGMNIVFKSLYQKYNKNK